MHPYFYLCSNNLGKVPKVRIACRGLQSAASFAARMDRILERHLYFVPVHHVPHFGFSALAIGNLAQSYLAPGTQSALGAYSSSTTDSLPADEAGHDSLVTGNW